MPRQPRPHDRELVKMLGTAIDIGAQIQQVTAPGLRRYGTDHGGPVNARQGFQHIARQGHQGTGITGTHTGLRTPATQQFQGNAHGGVRLAAQRLSRALVHADHFAGMFDAQTMAIRRRAIGNQFFKNGRVAN